VRWERHNRALRRECVPQCAHPIGHIEPSDECKAHCGASGSPTGRSNSHEREHFHFVSAQI
jgi:hypothetical protein